MKFWRDTAPLIYLLHIPKTAGSSVTSWLKRAAGEAAVCPAKNWDQLVALDDIALSSYSVFCGHYGMELGTFLGRPVRTCTILRHPMARTLSHYRHVHRDSGHPRYAVVSRQSFSEFVQDPDNLPMIDNFQARYLTESPLDLRRYVNRLDRAEAKTNRLSTTSEDARYLFDQSYVRERAMHNLERLDVVGVTERLQQVLADLRRAFVRLSDGDASDVPEDNVAPAAGTSDAGDARTWDLVRDLTRIDQELYDRARSHVPEIMRSDGIA